MEPQKPDGHGVAAAVVVALGVLVVTGVVVILVGRANPAVTATVLTGFAAVAAALPAIIKALRERG